MTVPSDFKNYGSGVKMLLLNLKKQLKLLSLIQKVNAILIVEQTMMTKAITLLLECGKRMVTREYMQTTIMDVR